MAKNTESTAYRKIDVDALDEDKFDDGEEAQPQGGFDERNVTTLLQSARNMDALHAVLDNPPMGSRVDTELKKRVTGVAARVLQAFKTTEMEEAVSNLAENEADVLVKLIYRAFELLADGALCQCLLQWHAHVVNKFGKGPIVRVFAARSL